LRRADRLFRLVHLLRGRRLSTAAWLAGKLEVSPRTVYRDVADLQAQGVPIEGEAGVGYRLRPGFDLPPLMFTAAEAQALVAAVRIAQPRLDRAFAAAAEEALGKILAVLPAAARVAAETLPLYAGPIVTDAATGERLQTLRDAVAARRKVGFDYVDAQGAPSARIVRPLGCFHWDAVWTLASWCEGREAFRSFRLDRMQSLRALEDGFRDEEGRTLPAYLRQARENLARRRAIEVDR